MLNVLKNFYASISIIDLIYLIITIFSLIKCYKKGFVLSILSMAKWLLAYIITLLIFPKIKPYLKNIIDNEYVLDIGLGISIFIIVIFFILMVNKGISKAVSYTGIGSLDSVFGFFFGFLRAYIISVCIFSVVHIVYNYDKWPTNADKSFIFPYLEKGSNYLLKEFPNEKTYKDSKEKLKNFNPKLKEECGVFGVSNTKDASALTALGLHALQHRGQEGCGIVSFDGKQYFSEKRFGLVGDNFSKEKVLQNLKGDYAIGHNRYSTTGENTLRNIQPFFADTNAGGIGVAHNGNLTNSISLRKKLVEDGAIFYTTSDTETIVQLIAKSKRLKTLDKIVDAIFQIQGGYALVMLTQTSLIGVRDPFGIRPLVIGKLKNSYVLASETCALDIIGAKFIREVDNGEIVLIENNELKSIKPFPPKKIRPCVFEYIYFARPDSILSGKTAYEHRKNLGAELAKENDINADIVVPVPDSGNAAALGFAQHLGMNFELGLVRNHYVGRTFIEPSQKIRSLGVKLKLNANKSAIKDKKIILVDDSLVRGTTSYKIVKMLYDAGAKEVHVKIACPEIKYPDFYGVDTPTKKELLAANKTNKEICNYIGARSLKFLSLDGMYRAIGFDGRNDNYPQLTDHYFTGDYPVKPIDELGDNKITQLSLLSTASNN